MSSSGSKRYKLSDLDYVEIGSSSKEECDDIDDDSEMEEYKGTIYKLFKFKDYKIKGLNSEATCPFCATEETNHYQYFSLLQHAIRMAEGPLSQKQRAKHYAMAKYMAFDLPNEQQAIEKEREDAVAKFHQLQIELNEKTDEMNDIIEIERARNDELQGARRTLIKGLEDIRGDIGIKYMGELDSRVFISELENRYTKKWAEKKGVEMCSEWQEKLKNPHWHPFQVIDDINGKPQLSLKEDDAALQELKKGHGQKIHDAVVKALHELREYNPSGCYVVPEIWNFKENRKANLEVAIEYVFARLMQEKQRRIAIVSFKVNGMLLPRLPTSLLTNKLIVSIIL